MRGRRAGPWAAWAAGLTAAVGVLVAACSTAAGPVARGRYVYVAASKHDAISQFRVLSSGALVPLKPAQVPAGQLPYGIAVSPQGTSVYAIDVGPTGHPVNKVSQFTINPSTGRLRPKSPTTVPGGRGGQSIVVSPSGKSAYVNGHDKVWQYTIDPSTGALKPMLPATVASAGDGGAIAVTPNGRYLYVATCSDCRETFRKRSSSRASSTASASTSTMKSAIWEYRISPSTGALSARPFGIVATGGAQWMAIAPNGRSAYVAATGGGRGGPGAGAIWQYTIDPTTGRLTPKSPATAARGFAPHNIVIGPNGKNAYVTTVHNNKIAQYRINQSTGTLDPHPASTATTVLAPEALAIAANGKSAYVTSEGNAQLSQFTIDPTTGTIKAMTPATVKTASGALGVAVTP